jgi:hypothetical protein
MTRQDGEGDGTKEGVEAKIKKEGRHWFQTKNRLL